MRVVIVDDQALFREGLRTLLEAHGVEVVGEASNGREAVDLVRSEQPDVVLMDLDMPEMNGLAATRLIKTAVPNARVIILTASEHDTDLFEAIKSGAQGYLMKSVRANELSQGAMRGEPALTPDLASKLLGEFARPSVTRHERASDELTEREREVLELLVQGSERASSGPARKSRSNGRPRSTTMSVAIVCCTWRWTWSSRWRA
jgi:DNA-binding NarL/FixJ family response regulator